MSYKGKPSIKTFNFSRRLAHLKPGRTRSLRLGKRRIKVALDKDCRTLHVLDALASVVADIQNLRK